MSNCSLKLYEASINEIFLTTIFYEWQTWTTNKIFFTRKNLQIIKNHKLFLPSMNTFSSVRQETSTSVPMPSFQIHFSIMTKEKRSISQIIFYLALDRNILEKAPKQVKRMYARIQEKKNFITENRKFIPLIPQKKNNSKI